MADLIVEIEQELIDALETRARLNGVSAEEEHRRILAAALGTPEADGSKSSVGHAEDRH